MDEPEVTSPLGFRARYLAEVARRPWRLVTAALATATTAFALLAANALAGPAPGGGPAPDLADSRAVVPAAPAPVAPPGDATGWTVHAHDAAAACPGLPPEVLVAIGQVESRLGADLRTSSAGAVGPMQFLPGTWVDVATDGDGDGAADVMNAIDAMHGAARLLCAHGGGNPTWLRWALWNYNRSGPYVDEVLRHAGLPA